MMLKMIVFIWIKTLCNLVITMIPDKYITTILKVETS